MDLGHDVDPYHALLYHVVELSLFQLQSASASSRPPQQASQRTQFTQPTQPVHAGHSQNATYMHPQRSQSGSGGSGSEKPMTLAEREEADFQMALMLSAELY